MASAKGELTMLFTDIEGSTRLAQALGAGWPDVLAAHRRLIRDEVERAGGTVEMTEGDSFFATFPEAVAAAHAAGAVQRALGRQRWPAAVGDLRVRIGIHAGAAQHTDGHWVGVEVHRAARIANAANGGQVVVSEPVLAVLGEGWTSQDLGRHRLKDFTSAERLFHLCVNDRVAQDFRPLRTLGVEHSILERELELARISSLVERVARGGRGATLVVEGPAGIGKTRLMDELRGIAVEQGMAVCAARGAELEQGFPFGLVVQLVDPALAAAGAVRRSELLDGAAALALGAWGEKPAGGAVDAEGVMHGLYWLLAALADHSPLLLSVDDAQWSDDASLRFLAYLFRRAESLPMLVAVACRPPPSGETGTLVSELVADPGAEVLRPTTFGVSAARRLLAEWLARPADLEFAQACLDATGGNPFLLGELARELRVEEVEPRAQEAGRVAGLRPDNIARSLRVRVERAGGAGGRLAPAIALLGDGADLSLAGELVGLAPEAAGEALDALVREGVLAHDMPPRYAHPLLRTAAEGLLAPAERSRLHARAAALLTARGASVERVASHLLETQPSGERRTVEVLADAALEARDRGAPEVAARLLRRALGEPPAAEERPELRFELGRAERDLGLRSARESLRAAADAPDPVLAARATCALLWAIGPDPEEHRRAIALVDRAIERVAGRDRELARELEALRLGSLWIVPELAEQLERELPRYRDLPGESPAESLALTFVARVLMERGEPAAAVEAVGKRATANVGALRNDDMAALWLINAAVVMMAVDRLDVAQRVVERALAMAHERGSANRFAIASSFRGIIRHQAGDLGGAEADARAALDSEGLKGVMGYHPVTPLVGSLADQGRTDEGRRVLAGAQLDGLIPEARPLTALLVERGRLLVAAGDAAGGLSDLEEARTRLGLVAAQKGAIGFDAWLDRIMALRALGRSEDARLEADRALAAAHAWGSNRAVGGALRMKGLVAGGREGVSLLREAVETLAASQARLWHARALVDLGTAQRRAGRGRQAREHLQGGLELAERCGAVPLAENARQELAATGVDVPSRDARHNALTASERRIAELAADGASNRQIAQRLFVTVKTVEGHLSHAYRKLEIRSRRELGHALVGHGRDQR